MLPAIFYELDIFNLTFDFEFNLPVHNKFFSVSEHQKAILNRVKMQKSIGENKTLIIDTLVAFGILYSGATVTAAPFV